MQQVELFIGTERLELKPDIKIALVLQSQNFGDISEKVGSFSRSFTVPATSKNRAILENAFTFTSNTDLPYRILDAILKVDGVEMPKGNVIFENDGLSQKEIRLTYYTGNAPFYQAANTTALRDICLQDAEHCVWDKIIIDRLHSPTEILTPLQSDTSPYITYPLVSYTNNNSDIDVAGNPPIVRVNKLFPAVPLDYIRQSIEKHLGYTITGTLFETDVWKRLLFPYSVESRFSRDTNAAKRSTWKTERNQTQNILQAATQAFITSFDRLFISEIDNTVPFNGSAKSIGAGCKAIVPIPINSALANNQPIQMYCFADRVKVKGKLTFRYLRQQFQPLPPSDMLLVHATYYKVTNVDANPTNAVITVPDGHGVLVNDIIEVIGINLINNGLYTVTQVTSTTITFARNGIAIPPTPVITGFIIVRNLRKFSNLTSVTNDGSGTTYIGTQVSLPSGNYDAWSFGGNFPIQSVATLYETTFEFEAEYLPHYYNEFRLWMNDDYDIVYSSLEFQYLQDLGTTDEDRIIIRNADENYNAGIAVAMSRSILSPQMCMPKVTIGAFLKTIAQIFAATINVNEEDRTVVFTTLKDIYDSIPFAKDWSSKLVNFEDITWGTRPSKYGQNNIIEWDNEEYVGASVGGTQRSVNDYTLPKEVTLLKVPYSGSSVLTKINDEPFVAYIPRLDANNEYNPDGNTKQHLLLSKYPVNFVGTQELNYQSIAPTGGGTQSNLFSRWDCVVGYWIRTYYKPQGYILFDVGDDRIELDFNGYLWEEFWTDWQELLSQYKEVTVLLKLSANDVQALDFNIPIYISYLNSYFYIQKINEWHSSSQPCKVELLKLQ